MVPCSRRRTETTISWCLVTASVPRLPSTNTQPALALQEKGCRFSWDTQKTPQQQPREGDLEQQQPAEKGKGQGPLLSAHSGEPDPAPLCLPCHNPKKSPGFPNLPMQPSHL